MILQEFKERINLVIFDLDGTLVDSQDQIELALNAARTSLGYSTSPAGQIFEKLGLPVQNLFGDLDLSPISQVELISVFRKRLYEHIDLENKCFPGVELLLEKIREAGMKTAIATGKSTRMAKRVVDNSALGGNIDFVQGTDGFQSKPHPEVINRCLNEFPGCRAIMIGDRVEDIKSASRAGIPSIGIAQSAHSESTLQAAGASLTFQNASNLREWFTSQT